MLKKLLTLLFTIVTVAAYAAPADTLKKFAYDKNVEYKFTHYDDHNGLSQWHLTCILQDRSGFMWFATWNGLNRYDGYDFAVFKAQPGDGNNITSDRIRNMQLGDDGHIYCLVNDRIWRFNLYTYRFEKPDQATQERYKTRIMSDPSVQAEHPMTVCGRRFERIRQVFTDSQRNVWVMGVYGVYKASPAPQPADMVTSVPVDIIRGLYIDRKKRIWVTTRNTGTVVLLDSVANLMGYLGPDGRLHRQPLRFAPVYSIMQQRDGTLWLGSKPGGLFRLRERADGSFDVDNVRLGEASQYTKGLALNNENIYDIKEDTRGRLWVATHGGGINMIENPDAPIDPATGMGLKLHNMATTFKAYPTENRFVRRLLLSGDSLVLATTTEGFLVMSGLDGKLGDAKFTVHVREADRKESLSSSATMDMLIDRKGRLLITTESGGVNVLQNKNLTDSKFVFRHFNTSNGMGSDAALAMTEVGDEILVQCNNQVSRINIDLGEVENFNDLFFSMVSRFSDAEPVMLKDGRWLLTMETGLMVMHEQMFHQRTYVPRIVLTSFAIPGRPVDYTADQRDTIRLGPSERNITIQYAALDYTDNSHIKYVTRMSKDGVLWNGKDSLNWSAPQETRNIGFYDLKPGTYKLEIRSTNAEGLWMMNTRTVTIIVEPKFGETALAYILYFLLTVAVISGVTYTIVYIRALKRQREENLKAYLKLFEQKSAPQASVSAAGEAERDGEQSSETLPTVPETAAGAVPESAPLLITATHMTEEDDAFMRRLLEFVDGNLGDSSVGVDEMAAATATSRSSLNRKMKQLLGVTPADFLKEARMKRACQQLVSTSKGVNDIAYSCGFSDPKYFSKCFKASTGMSPSDYRASR